MDPGTISSYCAASVALVAAASTFFSGRADRKETRSAHEEQKASSQAQITAQKEQIERQEHQLREAANREHFKELWEARQKGYLEIASWALSLRESIRLAREQGNSWRPPILEESGYAFAALYLYADYEVYDAAGQLHGGVTEMIGNLAEFPESEKLSDSQIDQFDEKARSLVILIRKYALTRPSWREPISFDDAEPRT